jgi:hypothetical protein
MPPLPDDVLQWEECMFQGRCHYRPYREMAYAIWSGNAIIGTNGSASNDNRTYSFVILTDIENNSPTITFKCGRNLPALADHIDMDLHHHEAAALYASLCFVHLLLSKYPRRLTTGLIPCLHFVLDNKSVAEDDLKWEFEDSKMLNISILSMPKAECYIEGHWSRFLIGPSRILMCTWQPQK